MLKIHRRRKLMLKCETRELILNQVARQKQVIAVFNGIINDLKNGIDQIG